MSPNSKGAHLWKASQLISLYSFLLLLLLPKPSRCYSLKNCTTDPYDHNKVYCIMKELEIIPYDIPKTATDLDLSDNSLTKISKTNFTGFSGLRVLSLSINQISHIDAGAFSDLLALRELILSINFLKNLRDNVFDGLSDLLSLDLSHNKIESISKFAFQHLSLLQELKLNNNHFADMNDVKNALLNCPLLHTLYLGSNNISSIHSDVFPDQSLNLTYLDISEQASLDKISIHSNIFNKLETLILSNQGSDLEWEVPDKAFFKSLKSLDLRISRFELYTYQMIFESVSSVQTLFLSRTDHDLIAYGVLDLACHIPSLRRLDLSLVPLSSIDDLFDSCTNIVDLNISGDQLRYFSPTSMQMLTALTRLYIEVNFLTYVPEPISRISTLQILSLKSNYITQIECSQFSNLTSLTDLDLSDNDIYLLLPCAFTGLLSLKYLNIEKNHILILQGLSLPNLMVFKASRNSVGNLANRIFEGLPSLTDLSIGLEESFVPSDAFEGLKNLKNLSVHAPFFLDDYNGLKELESLKMDLYLDHKVTYELTNYAMSLPSLQEWILIADAEVTFHTYIPEISHNLTQLKRFSSNKAFCNIETLNFLTFAPHLEILQVVNCATFIPSAILFQSFTDLEIMDLRRNNLQSLDFLIETNLTRLDLLILQENKLTVINESVFASLPSLKYLDLSGNPFVCDCSNAGFIEWVITNKQVQVVGAYQYTCSSPSSEEGHFLLDFNVQSCWEFTGFLCFICSSALVLLTLLSSFIFHFLRWQLVYGYYLLLAFLYDSKKRRQGCPHIYDAFVSYNVHDEDWVYGELLPELEGRQGWRLCLHHRDFLPGKPIIENITDAIYSSRKTLCVISRRYLQSEWCSREIQLASFRLFDEQKDVLVLLFLEELSSDQLSPFYRMRKLVKRRTYLSWTQAQSHKGLFWEKVRRALGSGDEPGDNHNPLTTGV